MGRKKSLIPSLYLHRASGQWCCNIHGKRQYLGKDLARAQTGHRQLCVGILAGPESPVPVEGSANGKLTSASELLLAYRDDAARRVCPTQLARIEQAGALAAEAFGDLPADRVNQSHIEAMRRRLLEDRTPRGLPYSRRYVNHLTNAVRAAFRWGASKSLVSPAAALAVRSVLPLARHEGGRETPRVLPVPLVQVEETLPHLYEPLLSMIRLQLLTGMRPGEVVIMRRADVSRNDSEILYPDDGPPLRAVQVGRRWVWLYLPRKHKTLRLGKLRVVPLGPEAQAILSPWMQGEGEYLFEPCVQGRRRGLHYTTQSYCRGVARIQKEKGLARWSPGRLRHNAASLAVDVDGYDAAAALLGHARPDMTAHYAEQAVRRAAELMAKHG